MRDYTDLLADLDQRDAENARLREALGALVAVDLSPAGIAAALQARDAARALLSPAPEGEE